MIYTEADYAKFPGLPRPRKIQTPRKKISRRFPWKCATIADVKDELRECPGWARGFLAIEYQERLLNWDDASELVKVKGIVAP